MKPDFPHVIDATMIATYGRSCRYKLFRQYVEHWKPKGESIHLHAGAAFARGLEVTRRKFYEDRYNASDALATGMQALVLAYGDFGCPEGSNKFLERMMGALEYYFNVWPLGEGAQPHVSLRDGHDFDPRALRAELLRTLPEYMVPAVLVPLDRLPLSPSGKVDRHTLPEPADEAPRAGTTALHGIPWRPASRRSGAASSAGRCPCTTGSSPSAGTHCSPRGSCRRCAGPTASTFRCA